MPFAHALSLSDFPAFHARETERFTSYLAHGTGHKLQTPFGSSVLLSAPHAVEQWRNGGPKQAESETGVLVCMLSRICRLDFIVKTDTLRDDANYDEKSPYKDAIAAHVGEGAAHVLLDLHIMSPAREHSIDIGTGRGRNILGQTWIPGILTLSFTTQGFTRVEQDLLFTAGYKHTVSATIASRCNIPCVQIEINARLFSEPSRYLALVNALSAAVASIAESYA